jgi:hypothetical protein
VSPFHLNKGETLHYNLVFALRALGVGVIGIGIAGGALALLQRLEKWVDEHPRPERDFD